jgi:putative ABC transport system permease protein
MLRSSPGFTAVAVLSLALGIGANTTIFSVFNTMLLRPLPFKDPDRLVMIKKTHPEQDQWGRNPKKSTVLEWRKQSQTFRRMGMSQVITNTVTLSGADGAERGRVQFISPNLLSVLGVEPALGRSFLPEDVPAVPSGGSSAVLISHGLWERRFGADPNVLGQTFTAHGNVRTVIGVMAPGFWVYPWAKNADLWIALNLNNLADTSWLTAIGRLKPGASIDHAQAELDTISRRLDLANAETDTGWSVRVLPMHERVLGRYRDRLFILLGAVGFVLLIACANVANLLLARANARQKEIAVRASLGAGRLRLVRQLLTESATLALLGGALGVLLSLWGVELFVALAPQWFVRTGEIGIDATVLGFTLGISLLTGILFGLAPALRASKPDLNESLKEGGRRSRGGLRHRSHSLLVVSEVALALVLLVGAGLMINSFLRLQRVDLGFNPDKLLTAEILLEGPKYWKGVGGDTKRVTPQGAIFYERLLERVRSLPGVRSADIISRLPSRSFWPVQFTILGRPAPAPDELPRADYNEISSGFFRTIGVPLLKGRYLTERDVEASPWVVIINEAMARQFFPDEDPIGKMLHMSIYHWSSGRIFQEEKPRQIVGVVSDVRQRLESDPAPAMYGPYRQHFWEYPSGRYEMHLGKNLVIRTGSEPMSLATAMRRVISEVDKDQAVYDIMTMEDRLFLHATVQHLRRAGGDSGSGGHLRRHVVLRQPAHPRVRDPHGAGGAPQRCPQTGHETRSGLGPDWSGHRRSRRPGLDPLNR